MMLSRYAAVSSCTAPVSRFPKLLFREPAPSGDNAAAVARSRTRGLHGAAIHLARLLRFSRGVQRLPQIVEALGVVRVSLGIAFQFPPRLADPAGSQIGGSQIAPNFI